MRYSDFQLITVLKSGKVQIRDSLQGTVLCEPILPKSHELMAPWDPVVAVGAMGQILFLKGEIFIFKKVLEYSIK